MCFTNPGFIHQVIQDANDYFDGKGKKTGAQAEGDYFALVPMDAGSYCHCPDCQAQLDKSQDEGGWNGYASDYIFGFVNTVAKEIKKTHPDKYLACLSYSNYAQYPKHVKLASNVAVQLCLATRLWNVPGQEAHDMAIYRSWTTKEKDRPIFLWLYYCFPEETAMNGGYYCFPVFSPHTIDRQFKMFARDHIRGAFLNNLGDYLDHYLTFKLMDDPALNVDQLIDEFFTRFYGPAGKPLKALYLAIEATNADPKNYPQTKVPVTGIELAWKYLGTAERMAQFAALMAQAKAAGGTELQQQRVAVFEKAYWNYMQDGRKQYVAFTSTPLPVVTVPHVAPCGGDAGRVMWEQAAELKGWYDRGSDTPSARKLTGRIAHDGQYLYVELTDPCNPKQLAVSSMVFPCDDWEFFLAAQREPPYRQFAVGPTNLIAALTHGEDNGRMNVEWKGHGIRAFSDTSAPDRWTMRVSIPLANVIKGGVAPGGKFYMNVMRISNAQLSGKGGFGIDPWVSYTSVHNVTRLGEMRLAE